MANGESHRISRRQFLKTLSAAGMVLSLGEADQLWAALAGAGHDGPAPVRVLLETGFEPGQTLPPAPQHQVVPGKARTGACSLMGEVTTDSQACILAVPYESKAGKQLRISFWVCSDRKSACAVWIRNGDQRVSLGRIEIPAGWKPMQFSYPVEKDQQGIIEIVAPSSHNAPVGKAWIDDLRIIEVTPIPISWPAHVQGFPALAGDGAGTLWLAALERPLPRRCIGVYRLENGQPRAMCTLEPAGLTGIAPPAIAPLEKGCLVVFPVEQQDRWRLAFAFVDPQSSRAPACRYLDCPGTANISPAVAVSGNSAWVLWESNAGTHRGIYACPVERDGVGKIRRLSAESANSYNPVVVTREDGALFAAWDSFRDRSADIYGAWCHNGKWEKEQRLTADARIARHPALAVWQNQIWMAWQAQSYASLSLNGVNEQRVVVAQLAGNKLLAPRGLFEKVSPPLTHLLRPRLAFDPAGRLWLTARRSLGLNAGWEPLAWCYSGTAWSGPHSLLEEQGRWQPVPLAWTAAGGSAAVQVDTLPKGWAQQGIWDDWKSGLVMRPLPRAQVPDAAPLQTEPLRMPETDFSLAEKVNLCAALLPRQRVNHAGKALTLFWGDFHDHTDLSVCNRRMNPPGHDLFANERDIERLDFCALTDHGYNFDAPQWAYNGEQTRNNHDPGRFVTFLGEEWTSSKNPPAILGQPNRYGHHNLIFRDPYHGRFYDSYDGDISPADLWKQMAGVAFLCIPHELTDWEHKGKGNPPTDWNYTDERLQPVAEIFQTRQSYEYYGCPRQAPNGAPFPGYYLQDAWAKGIIIGVIASPDHGGGRGKVGVWANELTREAIFAAVRARHTYGTSGAKMGLFLRAGEAMMGDKVPRPAGAITFQARAVALRPIKEVVIFRNNQIVYQAAPDKPEVEWTWTDAAPPQEKLLWYYARIHAADDELAWSSPIWFT